MSYTFYYLRKSKVSLAEKISVIFRVLKLKLFFGLFPKGELIVGYHGNARLVLGRHTYNAIGNYYFGLLEPHDMHFALRFLRPTDFFIDVGANIGSYTVLLASNCKVRCISFEPVPSTFHSLRKNVVINGLEDSVECFNLGLASICSHLKFTSHLDGRNHAVMGEQGNDEGLITVEVRPLDEVVNGNPTMMKIDVEGFELEVLRGAERMLQSEQLKVIIIEINGMEKRYEASHDDVDLFLRSFGFHPFYYNGYKQSLMERKDYESHNTLYTKDLDFVKSRIGAANSINR
ncbi:MAG: FkbM family methyltransferase [Cyclobacteriaceae bacterium]